MTDWLRLVRAHNLLLAAGGTLAGGWIALQRIAIPREAAFAALSALALGAAGNALNDLADVAADRVNRPGGERPLAAGRLGPGAAEGTVVGGALLGVAAAGLVGGTQVAVALLAFGVMAAYSPVLKRAGVPGNVAVAVLAGLPLWYGALAVGEPRTGLVPWLLAGWIHLVREIVKDVVDEPGDRAIGRRTLAVRRGAASARRLAATLAWVLLPVSAALPWVAGYRWPFFVAVLPGWAGLVTVARGLRGDSWRVAPRVLKAVMVVGLVALVLGRLV